MGIQTISCPFFSCFRTWSCYICASSSLIYLGPGSLVVLGLSVSQVRSVCWSVGCACCYFDDSVFPHFSYIVFHSRLLCFFASRLILHLAPHTILSVPHFSIVGFLWWFSFSCETFHFGYSIRFFWLSVLCLVSQAYEYRPLACIVNCHLCLRAHW